MKIREIKTKISELERSDYWLLSVVIALLIVPAYMVIWMFHLFVQVALVPLAYVAMVIIVVALVVKVCIMVISIKRKLKLIKEYEDGT